MVVFSNHKQGAAAEVLVSPEVASSMLQATAEAARATAEAQWEHELVRWLEERAREPGAALDVSELAWTPTHFEPQRRFVTDAIARAAVDSDHGRALALWGRLVAAHRREDVTVGRRWRWTISPATH